MIAINNILKLRLRLTLHTQLVVLPLILNIEPTHHLASPLCLTWDQSGKYLAIGENHYICLN